MCGISGIHKNGSKAEELKGVVELMNRAQKSRGPDDEGLFLSEKNGLAFGHNRLSILDLSSAGHQPMFWTSDDPNIIRGSRSSDVPRLAVTFNGEIYNFQDLRKELETKGHHFKTKTDTEVILAAFAEWGVESFSKLRGMFAFGLWDNEKKKLYLVKDRYGIKPLYYFSNKEKIIFASTVKALKVSGMVPDKKNEKAAIGFLLFGSVPLPQTTLAGVFGIPAGHYLVRDASCNEKIIKYYEPLEHFTKSLDHEITRSQEQKNISITDYQLLVTDVRRILEDLVAKHLISDAPLGVFLSGGVDSSVLALLASDQRKSASKIGVNQRLTTLSITFDEPEFSEKKYQHLIADKIQSDHHEYKVTKGDFENTLPDIWEAMDQPTIDGVNTYFVAEAAKKAGLKAVLSGLGADEIFFGYPSFRKAAMLRKAQNWLSIFGHRKSQGLAMSRALGFLGGKYAKLGYLCSNDPLHFYLAVRGLFTPAEVTKILGISQHEVDDFITNMGTSDDPNIGGLNLLSSDVQKLHPADLLSYMELKFYLQNQLLKDSDFMAMRHSIEIRVPFLDHVLVEYLSSLPAKIKLAGINQKQLLIDAVPDLPKAIYERPKMGFTFPFQKWLSASSPRVLGFKFNVLSSGFKVATGAHWSRRWALSVADRFL